MLLVLTRSLLHQEIQFRLFLTEQILAGKYWVEGTDAGGAVSVPPKLKQGAGAVARCTWHWLWLLIEVCTAALHLLHLLTVGIAYSAMLYCICSATTTATSTTASAQEALGRWSATGALRAGSWSPKPAPLLGGCASNWSTFELGQQITLWQQPDASRDLTFRSTMLENFKTMI